MRNTRRALKNKVYKYDEGQCLIRELTCNSDEAPKRSELDKLALYISKHQTDSYHPWNVRILSASFKTLWGRLTDYQRLRHVEKSLLVIEHLLLLSKEKDTCHICHSFEAFVKENKRDIVKLKGYHYKIDGTDIGQNVRQRATNIYNTLWKNESVTKKKKKKPSKKPKDTKKKSKKKRKKTDNAGSKSSLFRFNSQSVTSLESESDGESEEWDQVTDIFDIFGELPVVEQSEEMNDVSFIESKTSTTNTNTFSLMQSAGIEVVHSDSEQS